MAFITKEDYEKLKWKTIFSCKKCNGKGLITEVKWGWYEVNGGFGYMATGLKEVSCPDCLRKFE